MDAEPGTVDQFVEVPGGRLFVRRWRPGARAQAPIVLLHDSLGSVELWRDFPGELAELTGREVIAYDRLGFGHSTPRTGRPSDRFIIEEAEVTFPALQRALDLERVVLFGHSVGGGMALVIAALHGDRCAAVITESAQAFVEARTLEGIRVAKVQFRDPEQFERIVRRHGERARWVLDAWTEVWTSPAFRDWSLDPWLPSVTCPVLAIHGADDEFGSVAFPARIARRVRGPAEQEVLEGCGHVPHRERRDDVLRVVASFLARHDAPAA